MPPETSESTESCVALLGQTQKDLQKDGDSARAVCVCLFSGRFGEKKGKVLGDTPGGEPVSGVEEVAARSGMCRKIDTFPR